MPASPVPRARFNAALGSRLVDYALLHNSLASQPEQRIAFFVKSFGCACQISQH